MPTTTARTAAQTYHDRRRHIDAQLDLIRAELERHAARFAADSGNWGWAGDLGKVREDLHEILTFIATDDSDR